MREKFTFSEILAIFRLLKTFFSYQQVINNAGFSTQFFGKWIGEGVVFEVKRWGSAKLHNSLKNKEIRRKRGEINSATVASLRKFGVEVVEKLSTICPFLREVC